MEKLRFTQLFRESEKELSPEEKLDIILAAYPDKEDEIKDDFEDAKFNGKLEDFFTDYKDVLDNANINSTETDVSEDSNDVEANSSEDIINDDITDSENNDVQDEEELENNMSDEQLEKKVQNEAKAATVNNGKSKLVFDSELYKKVLDTLLGDNKSKRNELEKHFEEYEEFFGFTPSGKKSEVKVMFRTPEDWPVKTGDYVKKDDPLFESIACMNEFALWMMGAEIWSKTEEISDLLKPVFENDKIAGTELNRYIKTQSERIAKQQGAARLACINGTTEVNDPLELSENGNREVHNDLLIFMYLKVIPTIFRCIKTGGAYYTATARISDPNSLYGQLYRIAHDSGVGDLKGKDEFTDIVYDSFAAFLGGRVALRAPYENVLLGHPEIDKSNADVLCIFDTGFIDNEYTKSKNIFKKMADEFTARNPEFKIQNTRKAYGKGAIKTLGKKQTASGAAARGETDEIIHNKLDLGEYSEEDVNDIMKARKDITTEHVQLEPFAVIANKLSSMFSNFASAMTRAGAKMRDVSNVYGRRFFSDEDIKNAPETLPPNRKKGEFTKSEMIASNEEWKKALTKIKNFNPMSINTPTTGKDGESGELGDKIAAPGNLEDQANTKIELNDEFTNIENIIKDRNKKISQAIKEGDDNKTIGSAFYSMLKMEQMLYASFTWLNFSPRNAFDFAFGKWQRPDGTFKGVSKVQKWTSLAVDSWGGKGVDGTKSHPYFGLGHTVIPTEDFEPDRNTLIDSLHKLHNKIGLWYLNTPEGNTAREDFIKFLKDTYDDTIAKFKDFVRPIQGRLHSSDVNLTEYVQSLGLMGALWRPNFSTVSDDITVGARGVYGDGPIAPEYQTIYDATNKAKSWVIAAITKPMTNESFDVLLNPRSKNRESNSIIVEKIKDLTGINLYSFWDDNKQQADAKGIKAAFKAWSDLTGNHFDLHDNTTNKAALNIDDIPNVLTSKNALLGSKLVTPSKNKPYDQHDLVVSQTDDLLNKHRNFMNQESLETFFGEVFREASEKETPKKQRFTIN